MVEVSKYTWRTREEGHETWEEPLRCTWTMEKNQLDGEASIVKWVVEYSPHSQCIVNLCLL